MNKLFNPDDKLSDFIDRHAGKVICCLLIVSMLMDNL
jgi:hypothetical protein